MGDAFHFQTYAYHPLFLSCVGMLVKSLFIVN